MTAVLSVCFKMSGRGVNVGLRVQLGDSDKNHYLPVHYNCKTVHTITGMVSCITFMFKKPASHIETVELTVKTGPGWGSFDTRTYKLWPCQNTKTSKVCEIDLFDFLGATVTYTYKGYVDDVNQKIYTGEMCIVKNRSDDEADVNMHIEKLEDEVQMPPTKKPRTSSHEEQPPRKM
jgi:hypothetical protein